MVPRSRPSSLRRSHWIELATRRIRSILSARIAALFSQLVVKICESGPENQRPDPHILTAALSEMLDRREIRRRRRPGSESSEDPYVYSLRSTPVDQVDSRTEEINIPYEVYRLLTRNKTVCGDVLEGIISASFSEVRDYVTERLANPSLPLDGLYSLGDLKIGVEVKNVRPWIYPSDEDVWEALKKCMLENAAPLFVARKLHWLTFQMFSEIGAMGFEFHRQVFRESVALYLPEIQHKDKLGFKDVIAKRIVPHPSFVWFLNTVYRRQAASIATRWQARRELVEEYAVTKDLANVSEFERRDETIAFVRELLHGGEPDDFDDYFGI